MARTPEADKIFIGIDVSKEHLDIFVHPLSIRVRIDNAANTISAWLRNHAPSGATVIFEATGGYERVLQKSLAKFPDLVARRIHPAQVKSFARAFGRQAKSDTIDAEMLAKASQQLGDLLHDNAPDETIRELRDLLARRQQLMDMLHAEQCRSKMECLNKAITADLKSNINNLKKRIDNIEQETRRLAEQDKLLQERYLRLQKVDGVGKQVAMTVLAFLPEIGKLDRKKIAAIAGLAPITRQSGKSSGKARIRGGRQMLKKALYMAALVGVRHNKVLKDFYQSMLKRQKPKMVALIAAAKKLLLHLNAIEKIAQIN